MKKLILILCLLPLLSITSCEDDDNNCQGIDCLPPATQTGAGTFGCLVNGEAFVDNSGFFNCFYQFVDGEYFFNISPNFSNRLFIELDIGCRNVNFQNEQSFDLAISTDGGGAATFLIREELRNISTNTSFGGFCEITTFDLQNNIISGTFEFEIFDEVTQTLYIVTDGRFDSQFTQ